MKCQHISCLKEPPGQPQPRYRVCALLIQYGAENCKKVYSWKVFPDIVQRGKKPSLGVSEVDSSLNLCVTLVMQLYEDDG